MALGFDHVLPWEYIKTAVFEIDKFLFICFSLRSEWENVRSGPQKGKYFSTFHFLKIKTGKSYTTAFSYRIYKFRLILYKLLSNPDPYLLVRILLWIRFFHPQKKPLISIVLWLLNRVPLLSLKTDVNVHGQ